MRQLVRVSAAVALLLVVSTLGGAQAANKLRVFVSRTCGFQVALPADWKVQPARSKKCSFTIVVPWAGGDIELVVRDGNLDDNQLGFTKENEIWILHGEGSAEAQHIQSASWTGLQGSVDIRIYRKEGGQAREDQTRAVLFDHKNRIAEVTCFDDDPVAQFVKGFEFLGGKRQ
jgi:hypothetical protein